MKILKRSGEEAEFDAAKIENAIAKANAEVAESARISPLMIKAIAEEVGNDTKNMEYVPSVEDIQDEVIYTLGRHGAHVIAAAYTKYRYKRELIRKANTTDDKILALVNLANEEAKQENSNKDPVINSTQRDYIAGYVSRDIAERILLPEDVVNAHKKGTLHVHDTDYYIHKMHNCFHGHEKLVTSDGVVRFCDLKDGEIVKVVDKDGNWREATVHQYGTRKMKSVTFKSGRSEKTIVCTEDHRWILKDGSVTTSLKKGDILWRLHALDCKVEILTKEEAKAFCIGFTIGDGHDRNTGTIVRLCGKKIKYAEVFKKAGYSVKKHADTKNDVFAYKPGPFKQAFLTDRAWRFMTPEMKKFAFLGLYAADGRRNGSKSITTSDKRVEAFIEESSSLAGFYVASRKEIVHDTNYKEGARLVCYHFRLEQPDNLQWSVSEIKTYGGGREYQAWCVEEPVTESFTLDGGIVTGNCCLVDLEDMLQNGTVISETMIEPPKSFRTAATITSQVVSQVASNQFGGQTYSLGHIAPFIDISRQKNRERLRKMFPDMPEDDINAAAEAQTRQEVVDGVQTLAYQLQTLLTTNGQTPFVSVFMYLGEVPEGQTRDDLAMLIEETLRQRILGMKNEKGAYVTPAFPKLLYVLEEDNIREGTKYWYLTELAAECTAKRMVPDYISEKKMMELKGDTYGCMGCVDGEEVVAYRLFGKLYVESFRRMWQRLSSHFATKIQKNGKDLYMDVDNVEIYDQKTGFTDVKRVIRNRSDKWVRVRLSNGRVITCTEDHPFETENRGTVMADSLKEDDVIAIDQRSGFTEPGNTVPFRTDKAWLLGILLCDSAYCDTITVSLAGSGEDDIEENVRRIFAEEYSLETKTTVRDRGVKGLYKDVRVISNGSKDFLSFKTMLMAMFGGKAKADRHIPNEVFGWCREARMAFMAGMIDADGYINGTMRLTTVQIGSTNKELALQQAMLAQTLGMDAAVYTNYYKSNRRDMIRYRVEFVPSEDLAAFIRSQKKLDHLGEIQRKNSSVRAKSTGNPIAVEVLDQSGFSYDVTTDSEHFTVSGIYSHNCRSFLTPDTEGMNEDGSHKYYGRFNQGVVTINLPHVALESGGSMDRFWEIFEDRLELCHKALRCKHERLLGTVSDVAPILWQHGALARLKKGETIDKLLFNNYSTISLGYAGLYECVRYMTGKSHTDPEGKPFGLAVMQKLNDKCAEWRAAENISYSLYGTPMESTTYKFAKANQRDFGIIPGVTDKNYITNSYHVHVAEEIDAFTKLKFEAEFQALSPGGAISYVEVPDLQNNIPAVLSVMQYIYDNIMYAELNTKSDYCQECGYTGEIQIVDDDGKLVWECPQCGNRNQDTMNVARRTCGYIGTQYWNQGRTAEIKDRVLHL